MTTPTDAVDGASAPKAWRPYREPIAQTLFRTFAIALIVGGVVARPWRGSMPSGLGRWTVATLLALWPAFRGHWVELGFLNRLRPRLPDARAAQAAGRFATWFVGGVVLMFGACLTAKALVGFPVARWPAWWVGGMAFIGIELFVHFVFLSLGRPNFYDGRG